METVSLYYLEKPHIKISMEVYFNINDQLYFDGYDIGKKADEVWGDSDYEYTYTIEPEEVKKFYKLFSIEYEDRSALLQEIKKRFSGYEAYTIFGKYMQDNNIIFSSYLWM